MLKVIELFSGIGAQREALKRANIPHEVVGISEIDPYAIKTYRFLHGWTPNYGDIAKIKELPQADLWTYSFPCTDISLSGNLQGFSKDSGTRSSLLWEVQRLLEVSKEKGTLPRFLLLENVKNIISKRFMPLFQEWIDYLSSLGYKSFYQVLNSKNYGVPQNRERCFMISILNYDGDFNFPNPFELETTLQDLLEDKVDAKYFLSEKMVRYITSNNEKWTGNNRESIINRSIASTITTGEGSKRCDASNYVSKEFPVDFDLKKYLFVNENTKLGYAVAEAGDGIYINRPHQKRGTVQKSMVPTIKASPDIGVVVNEKDTLGVRRLTPRECWRLMGWNDERIDRAFEAGCSETQYYKMAGNSIVVNVLVEVFKALKNCINIT